MHLGLISNYFRSLNEDFLYEGDVAIDVNDLLELLDIMELSNYWWITSLHQKVQYDIIPLIDPLTVTESEIPFS
jgi:hypothetical protein